MNLVDSQFCVDGAKFLSAALVSLLTMTRLELPHVNVLTKVDLLRSYGPLGKAAGATRRCWGGVTSVTARARLVCVYVCVQPAVWSSLLRAWTWRGLRAW